LESRRLAVNEGKMPSQFKYPGGIAENLLVVLALFTTMALLAGCGTIPDARTVIGERIYYLRHPRFVGPNGPLTQEQGRQILARLQRHQNTATDILQRHLAFEQAITGEPLVLGNKVTLLENGTATYRTMLATIRGAHDSINLMTYIISDGPVGQMFADALLERQKHGVQVNIIYDSFGSMYTPASFFDRLESNGVAVLQYRPINPLEAKLPWTLTHRNHRKMMVVDGRVAFTGGINISEEYASGVRTSKERQPPQYWRDTDIEVEGPVVEQFQHLFIDEWRYQKGSPLSRRDYFPKLGWKGADIVRLLGSVPERFNPVYIALLSAIINSETNAYITDAYFAPDRQVIRVLEHAAQRGVDVRLLLPSQSDEPLIVSAQRSHYDGLLRAGVKIYEWQEKMLHAKTATIDGVWSTVGSSNLHWWSIARNNEINAVILSHPFGDEMNLMFRNDLEDSSQIEPQQWEHRGMLERLRETLARLMEPLL
jgi:cardiolipin synthase